MNRQSTRLLDLPNEILFLILRKLNNVDVLSSLLGINNQRLEIVAQQEIFTNILDFVCISRLTDEISPMPVSMLVRFCDSILPRIHINVRILIVEAGSMECILRAAIFPNLTQLKIYNFNKAIVSHYFKDDSLFAHHFKQQITDIVLVSTDNIDVERRPIEYTKIVYDTILVFFENLENFTIASSSMNDYPPLSLCVSPPMTCSSSTLSKLCINAFYFDDVCALLDGRLKQLTTLIVHVNFIGDPTSPYDNKTADPTNLKCFSLTCYYPTSKYKTLVLPLLRRMTNLQELTLYLIFEESRFISPIHLDNEIHLQMPRLHTFTFYFATQHSIARGTDIGILNANVQQSFNNMRSGQVTSVVNLLAPDTVICHIFSLPFTFDSLERVGKNIANITFNSITHLKLCGHTEYRYEFFVRLSRAFPFLQKLSFRNGMPPFWRREDLHLRHTDWCSHVEYPYLISLDIKYVSADYAEYFLNETKVRLPRLKELKITDYVLKKVTQNFTSDRTRRNCSTVDRLGVHGELISSKDVHNYFPSLSLLYSSDNF